MSSFDRLSPEAMEALNSSDSEAEKLLGSTATNAEVGVEQESNQEISLDYQRAIDDGYDKARVLTGDPRFSTYVLGDSQEYKLPAISTFQEKIKNLSPIYDHMEAKGWEPKVIFVPKGLDLEQWHSLFVGHDISSIEISEGAYYIQPLGTSRKSLEDLTQNPKELWDVGVISSSEQGIDITYEAPNTFKGHVIHPLMATRDLESIPGKKTIKHYYDTESLVKVYSPSYEAYLTLQLNLLESGEYLLDDIGGTICKEEIPSSLGGGHKSIYGTWDTSYIKIKHFKFGEDFRFYSPLCIRPTVMGSDL